MRKSLAGILLFFIAGTGLAQTLVFGASGLPATLDAGDADDGNSLVVAGQVTERLVGFEPGTTELAPALALSWEANDDATVWTFHLREDVNFHDGTPFNADAVVFNIERWNDLDHPAGHRADGKVFAAWNYAFGGPLGEGNLLAEVEAVDEYTVRMETTAPAPFMPSLWAAPYYQFGSPAAIEEAGVSYGTPGYGPVGTGPFRFGEWLEGERVVLERNDDYWAGPAGTERVVFRGIEEPTARFAELQAGTIDIAVLLEADDLDFVEADSGLQTALAEAELNTGYLGFHQTNTPLDDPLVRQAVAHAIDREAIIDAFYEGLGVVPEDHLPPVLFGHGQDWPYDYDPERAAELLAEAGYPDGFATEIWYMPVSRPYFPAPRPIAETVASYLADVGIDAELMTEDWATYLVDYASGKFPIYMLGWSLDYADPDNIMSGLFGGDAVQDLGWDSPETVAALGEARQIADPDERQELYAAVNDTVAEGAIAIPMAHNRSLNALRAGVDDWTPSPLGFHAVSLHPVTKDE